MAVLLLWFAKNACCQIGFSLSAETDHRFRGESLSDENPHLRLGLAYDHATGWYAGAAATRAVLNSRQRQYQILAYLGHARRWVADLSWEVGATAARFTNSSSYGYYGDDSNSNDYGEAYAGLIAERWNARVYYSPDYYGDRRRTTYVELNGGLPLDRLTRLVGHLGALASLGSDTRQGTRRVRYDTRLGVARSVGTWDVQLAWFAVGPGSGAYRASNEHRRKGSVLSVTYFF